MMEAAGQIDRRRMFDVLSHALVELPRLLKDETGWHSMDIAYHPPRVERLFRDIGPVGERRLLLHRIQPCAKDVALFHPHPWPSVMQVLKGTYWMRIGSSPDLTPPETVLTMQVSVTPECCFRYEMTDPDGWHAVVPVDGPVYSVMVIGRSWDRPIPEVSKDAGPYIQPLRKTRERELLAEFRGLLGC